MLTGHLWFYHHRGDYSCSLLYEQAGELGHFPWKGQEVRNLRYGQGKK